MDFKRTPTDLDVGCPEPRGHRRPAGQRRAQQLSIVTAFIDHSALYGNSRSDCNRMRSFRGGQLRTSGDRLPPLADNAYDVCDVPADGHPRPAGCFSCAGDMRINQNPELCVLQTLTLREHNRLARRLHRLNPHWSDGRLFAVARRLNIAQLQHIVYRGWLPGMLGADAMRRNGLIYDDLDGGYADDYNATVDAGALNEHATGAFRYFHTNIVGPLQ